MNSNELSIPMLDLSAEIDLLWDDLNMSIQHILRSGQFILGPEVDTFEAEFASFVGVKHAIACNSGTDALTIALRALRIGPGDEVITTPFSFFATAEAISLAGAHPVFADIDPRTFNVDPMAAEAAITSRTRAILPVHLYGQAADMAQLTDIATRHQLLLIEDVAQAFGGQYQGRMLGTLGQAAAFSFFPSKNLGAYGDAGMVTVNDDDAARIARMLRTHGSAKKYANEMLGYNSRMDSIQAAILSVKLPHVRAWNAARREAAARYDALLSGLPNVVTPYHAPEIEHVFHQYTIRITQGHRDTVRDHLALHNISSMIYYPTPIHCLPFYKHEADSLPAAEAAADEVLSLPMWPQITPAIQERVAQTLADAL